MRFILALIPPKEKRLLYIQTAQNSFAEKNDGYLLNDSSSTPHVTICAFQCESKLSEIWDTVQNWKLSHCPIRILGLMLKKGKSPSQHYSVGLSIARDEAILTLHQKAVNLLCLHEIQCLNPSIDLYQPHLTLAGIAWKPNEPITIPSIIDDLIAMPIVPFSLSLGLGDDIGQYLQTLYE